ncbi:MAG TPA: hypothetical protein VIS96_08065 [Terrimicrobiaceae bacterium]
MKAAFSLLVLVATISLARAGSFAGPPPFTNESPLQTGTDGTYQAIASGVNLTGVFSFQIVGGIQSSTQTTTVNSWVFFVDGNILQGSVVAAISQGKVAGILNGSDVNVPADDAGNLVVPSAFIIPGNAASGRFDGCISYNSPLGAFEGDGLLTGAPARVDQLVFLLGSTDSSTSTATGGTADSTTGTGVVIQPLAIPAGNFDETKFKFHGTRVSTGAPAASSSSDSSSSSS